eukprot:SAG11_NODE_6149_length_1377_cov_0.977308_3_plen_21_part_01
MSTTEIYTGGAKLTMTFSAGF